jgi:hypothetical protein
MTDSPLTPRTVPCISNRPGGAQFPSQKQTDKNADRQDKKAAGHETRTPDADAEEETDDPENGQDDEKQKPEGKQYDVEHREAPFRVTGE